MIDELSEMIKGFVEESHEAFEDIEHDLLTIETNPDDLNIVNSIFRVMHTIKGTAGFLALDDIGLLSHKIESIFDMIRRRDLNITPELMDTILPAIDLLKLLVFELIDEEKSNYDLKATIDFLDSIIESKPSDFTAPQRIDDFIEAAPETVVSKTSKQFSTDLDDTSHISPELRADFVIEAEEHLDTIEGSLLRLEKKPDDEDSINEVFRAIHSIKGTSDYVNIRRVTVLSHSLETIFDNIRKGSQTYSYELADVVLKGVDVLKTLVFMMKVNDVETVIDLSVILAQLNQFIELDSSKKENKAHPPSKIAQLEPLVPVSELTRPATVSKGTYQAFLNVATQQMQVIRYMGSSFVQNELDGNEFKVLLRALKTLGDVAKNTGFNIIAAYTSQLVKLIEAVSHQTQSMDHISDPFLELIESLSQEVQDIKDGGGKYLNEVSKDLGQSTPDLPEKIDPIVLEKAMSLNTTDSNSKSTSEEPIIKTMRVDSDRLDTFMNLIGEIIITRNTYTHLLGELAMEDVSQMLLKELKSVEASFSRISEDLQVTLMEMRMVSVKSVFQKIPRIVRDISRKTNKNIQLQVTGEETEIDKSIIEMIGDPLVHIVRNSCDHGIEAPEERARAGKPEIGSIILKASHLGGEIAIDVIDDGAGIDTARVLDIAIEKGLVSIEESQNLDKKTIDNFIFHPGFSTSTEVSDISGRGVGMDVVSSNIKKIHGVVNVESEKGHGTHIRLLLPLTLAVVDALMVINHNQKFAIPLESVMETIEIRQSELQKIKKKEAINLRGDVIGVSRLSDLLDRERIDLDPDAVLSIVFIQVGTRTMGIVVDDLSNQQEIVVKPLQKYLTTIPGISGSTILGNGEIILILDPAELIDLASL